MVFCDVFRLARLSEEDSATDFLFPAVSEIGRKIQPLDSGVHISTHSAHEEAHKLLDDTILRYLDTVIPPCTRDGINRQASENSFWQGNFV